MKMKIGIIYGGRSTEHDASLKSKENFEFNLDNRFEIVELIFIDRIGKIKLNGARKTIGQLIDHINNNNKEVFYLNLLHGQEGEDGSWCGLFDIIDGRGSFESVNTSSILMNKYEQSLVVKYTIKNLMIPYTIILNKANNDKEIIKKINSINSDYVMVKPNTMGASHFTGKFKKNEYNKILEFVKKIFEYDNNVLIQEFIFGEEYTCGVINYKNKLKTLPIIHVQSKAEFLDHKSKHIYGNTKCDFEYFEKREELEEKSIKLFKLFNIIGMCRFDFLISNGNIYYLEGNLIPGFSNESAFPMMLKKDNITLSDFLIDLIKSYDLAEKNNKYLPYRID